MKDIKIICIMAKSGTGKSTAINELCKDNKFSYVKSKTTRKPRENDINDLQSHKFIDIEQFRNDKEKNKILALYESPLGYFSYTTIDDFEKDKYNIYAIDIKAFNELSKKINIFGIYLDLDENERLKRLKNRNNSNKYLEEGHLDKKHFNKNDKENYLILNINNMKPQKIAQKIKEIIYEL